MAVAAVVPRGEAKVLSAELEENDSGSEWSSGVPEDSFSSDEGEQDDDVDDTPKTPDTKVKDAEESKETGNAGWAEAMAKVLNKKISSDKPSILLKNKERDVERKKEKQERLEQRKKLNKKREWEMMCRVKPDAVKDRENKPKSEDAPAWSILRDDYMMGASMKDWDKESEEENNAGGDSDIKQESESDSDR
ncbi:RRP15-like protein [Ophiophagus hannah]|uniref:RRP15-like protein n=1 Tax=Ophiophagus hannah TaxID=8665 RepID=V8NS91_OPHHA|nr:RRP15-like protein [Ophiophagus hannah]